MNALDYILGGGLIAAVTGVVQLYRMVKEGAKADRSEILGTIKHWNEDLVDRVERLQELCDKQTEEIAKLRFRVVELELFIKKHDLPVPD
ncbi:hypothetical protein DR950_36060 [Kitasatospora xanthocidica]|uniref:Uncharacterized protein n=1 Tax=Kitasatospora xanthocidica TaxID=83382 RepID=A0A373A463_9ACTN|nr:MULTISPECIES: hypothetical protein [Streptomycetaceae]MBD0689646.1 hypothetical protein [Streptomyces sp. CBMA123]RGD62452.1 hypothetical protein DR950_36060 [Kitasatospora xanthocidica]